MFNVNFCNNDSTNSNMVIHNFWHVGKVIPNQSCRKRPSEICLTEITHGSWLISGSRGVFHNLPLINLKLSSSFEILLLLFSIYVRFDAVTFSVCDDLVLDTTEPLSISFLSDLHKLFSFHLSRAPFLSLFHECTCVER